MLCTAVSSGSKMYFRILKAKKNQFKSTLYLEYFYHFTLLLDSLFWRGTEAILSIYSVFKATRLLC